VDGKLREYEKTNVFPLYVEQNSRRPLLQHGHDDILIENVI